MRETAIDVFPENALALRLFSALQTQWRIGMSGATGLDYSVLPVVEQRCGVGKKERRDTFHALQVMEAEFLRAMVARREATERQR